MRHLLALCMCLTLVFSSNGFAAPAKGLKAAFDELNYSLSVEWDQRDQEFRTEQMKKFRNQVLALKKKGASSEQLLKEAQGLIKDKRVRHEALAASSMIDAGSMSEDQFMNAIMATTGQIESRGASWSGEFLQENMIWIVLGVVIIAALLSSGGGGSDGTYNSSAADNCGYKGDGSFLCGNDCGFKANGSYMCGTNCGYKATGAFLCGNDCGFKADGSYQCGTNCAYRANGQFICY